MEWQNIIISVIGIVLTSLASWAMTRLIAWLNAILADGKAKTLINEAITTITSVVEATYQTYVQSLKENNLFTAEAQKTALNKAVETAKSQLASGVTDYLKKNGVDINSWLETQIESIIYKLKNQNKQ